MSHYRSVYRAKVRAALAAADAFADCTVMSAWAERIDTDLLPVIGVVTPSDRAALSAHRQSERNTTLQLVLKRQGGEAIEDRLDDDSAALEALVIGALRSGETACALEETTVVVNGEGAARLGTLVMSFRLTCWVAEAG